MGGKDRPEALSPVDSRDGYPPEGEAVLLVRQRREDLSGLKLRRPQGVSFSIQSATLPRNSCAVELLVAFWVCV